MLSSRSASLALAVLSLASLAGAQEPRQRLVAAGGEPSQGSGPSEFLRMTKHNGQPSSLDTAVVRYQTADAKGVVVDLIGAVHIGEAAYYRHLNELFDTYDVVLYELVAPEGTLIPKGGRRESGANPIAMLQDGAKNMLGLESQLEQVDYTKSHFVRADMTPQQIADKMSERGETALTLALSTFADVMRQQNLAAAKNSENSARVEGDRSPQSSGPGTAVALDELSLFDLMGNPLKMKRVLAQQFAETGALDQALGGSLNQLLIIDRNAEALKGLQKQMALGKRKIGIFYGAAHLPDLEKHLIADFGLVKAPQNDPSGLGPASGNVAASVNPRWLVAWDLKVAKEPELSQPASLLLNFLKAIEP